METANSWYVYFNGETPAGTFGCWKRDIKEKWCFEKGSKHFRNESHFSAAKKQIEDEQNKIFLETSNRAIVIWERTQPATPDHPYLVAKQIKGFCAKQSKSMLVVPLCDFENKMWSLQFISSTSKKFFLKKGKKKGLFCMLGDPTSNVFYICEGYATECSIYEATQKCTLVAFDAGNLMPVSKQLRELYPNKEIIICADNDQFSAINTGVVKANEAAKISNAKVIVPVFKSLELHPTDFNDLHCLEGLSTVRDQLDSAKSQRSESVPTNFSVNDEGVFFVPIDESGESRPPIKICSRLDIKARTRDEQGLGHGRLLEFVDLDGTCHQWAIPMEMLAGDGMEYRRTLLSRGLEISPTRKARELLTQYILSSRPERAALCVERTGWHKNTYILPDETIGTSDKEVIYQNKNYEVATYTQGSLNDWKQHVGKYCEGNSKLLFAVSVAFASALLSPLAEESGGFHFVGASSIGKTTLLQIAGSVWGGTERMQRWRTTSNALEATASMHNDSLLCLDEIGQMDPKEVGEVAYMLANGSGKGRCLKDGSMRKKNAWRLLFLSTGEVGLSDHISQGGKKIRAGQEVRFVDITADAECGLGIFENLHTFDSAEAFARSLNESSKKFFGSPIREFLKHVTNDSEFVKNFMNDRQCSFLKTYSPPNADGQVHRVARRFAFIAAAGELAREFTITDWQKNSATLAAARCLNDWIKNRGGLEAKESSIALSQVRHFFELHGESRFSSWLQDDQQKTINRAGFRRNGEFFVFPEVFKSDICAGLNSRYVAQLCIEKGWLVADGAGKAASSHRMPDTGTTRRVYHFSSKVFEDEGLL